jgi:hypothetical protein
MIAFGNINSTPLNSALSPLLLALLLLRRQAH